MPAPSRPHRPQRSAARSGRRLPPWTTLLLAAAAAIADARAGDLPPHYWHRVILDGAPAAIAIACPDCAPALALRCITPRRGLMQLTLPIARVANGTPGITKQITLTELPAHPADSPPRRATTRETALGFVPAIELAADDALLDRLMSNVLFKINFYGQRRVLRLEAARARATPDNPQARQFREPADRRNTPVGAVRALCQPEPAAITAATPGTAHCTWTVSLACSRTRPEATVAARAIEGAFVRATAAGYCVTLARPDLGRARALAARNHTLVERSCLP